MPDPLKPPTPIAIAVVLQEDCVLIGQRGPDVPLPGFWEFPGGKVEPGETPAAAAARECFEETGLQVEVGRALPTVLQQYDHDRVRLHFFFCTLRQTAPDPRPPFRWVRLETLREFEFPPANAALIDFLLKNQSLC